MSIASELAVVIDEMSKPENFGETVIVNGVTVPAIVSDAAFSVEYLSGLMIEGVDVIAVVPKKYLTTKPRTTTTVQINGSLKRIMKVEDDAVSWTLVCSSATS
jgi:hypothetical protein